MPKICYVEKKFHASSLYLIEIADQICEEYAEKGFDLTLRQLYYQFVARDIIPNKEKSYKRLGSILNDARLAGYLDWDHMVDRTRNLRGIYHYTDPADIINDTADDFAIDKWAGQDYRVEVWVEKEALVGVVQQICNRLDVSFFACKGFVSQSEMWRAARRIRNYDVDQVIILHMGDHDPSGIDMTRDNRDRLETFGAEAEVIRVALNMDQVRKYDPPPNPAKMSDSRAKSYVNQYGRSSWELDALDPEILMSLIKDYVDRYRDKELFEKQKELESKHVRLLQTTSEQWDEVVEFLEK
ncbi:hypothetical protein KJ966_24695 [bacterium]|nr:hypothetical protein [bacterium]